MNKKIKKTMLGAMAFGMVVPSIGSPVIANAADTVLDKKESDATNAGIGRNIPATNNITLHKRQYRQENALTEEQRKEFLNRQKDGVIKKQKGDSALKNDLGSIKDELGGLDDVKQRGIQNTGDLMAEKELLDTEAYRPDVYGEVEYTLFKLPHNEEVLKALEPTDVKYKVDMTADEQKKWSQAMSKKAKEVGEKIDKAYDRKNPGKALPYGAKKVDTVKIAKNGEATFKNVKTYDTVDGKKIDNIYIVVETISPKTVVGKSNPMFVSLPVTNDDGTYKKELHLIPKNKMEEQKVTMKKYGQDNDSLEAKPLAGAQFKIYEGMPPKDPTAIGKMKPITDANGKDLVAETNKEGKMTIKGLTRGNYFLVEQEVKGIVDGMEVKSEKYKDREDFKYLAGYRSKGNQYNVLRFCVDSAGRTRAGYIEKTDSTNYEDTIVTPDGTRVSSSDPKAAILSEQNILEYTNHEKPHFGKKLIAYEGDVNIAFNNGKETKDIKMTRRELKNGWNYFENMPFEVNLKVPRNLYQYSKFEFQDQLERKGNKDVVGKDKITTHAEYVKNKQNQIDFKVTAISAKDGKEHELKRGVDYFIPEGAEKSNEFQITFVNPTTVGWDAKTTEENHKNGKNRYTNVVLDAKEIKVQYKAQFNAQATPDVLYNNKAEFTYNNAPEKGLTEDRYNHDGQKFETFGHRFIKMDSGLFDFIKKDEEKQPLKGAEFIIRNKDGLYFNGYKHNDNAKGGEEPYFVKYANDEEAYKALKESKDHNDAVLVSNEKGEFEVKGLKEGDYIAVEMKAPKGYALNLNPETKFHVGEKSYTQTTEKRTRIRNRRKEEMPITGGTQIAITIAGGVAAFALVAYAVKRNKKEESVK